MQNYKLAKDFMGFMKGFQLSYDLDYKLYTLEGQIYFSGHWIAAYPDIFETVLSLEDEIDGLLMEYCNNQCARETGSNFQSYAKEYRNKIIKLFEGRK